MGTNRNERTVKEPATFKTEGCFGALGGGGGRVVTVTQRVKIETVECCICPWHWLRVGKADRLLVVTSSRCIPFRNTLVPGGAVFYACKIVTT